MNEPMTEDRAKLGRLAKDCCQNSAYGQNDWLRYRLVEFLETNADLVRQVLGDEPRADPEGCRPGPHPEAARLVIGDPAETMGVLTPEFIGKVASDVPYGCKFSMVWESRPEPAPPASEHSDKTEASA